MANMNLGSILTLTIIAVASASSSHWPEKYPIEVYHMLQERTQYGTGRDNRVRGTWSTWSEWSECSRTCGTGVQSQSRDCVPFRGLLRKRSIIAGKNGTNNARPICIGTYKRYHTCNTQECPNYTEDLRAEQCAKYNGRNYKGRSYVWIPFLDAPNSCALNCRAVGERFYATLEPAVMDGTPCDGPNIRRHNTGISMDRRDRWLCVAGQCKPVGCDGVIGSGVMTDACGVCGGQGKGCRLYEGIFMEPILPKGHQPVTTIPKGAMSLNISELRFSSNFLALRNGNGSYILNGPWSYSPSGTYKAAGTTLTYQRGDRQRSECILATGPLNESLHLEVLSQEFNPGVLYKYMLPLKEEPDERAIIAPPLLAADKRFVGPQTADRGNEIPDSGNPVTMTVPVPRIYDQRTDSSTSAGSVAGKKEEMKHPPTTVMAGDQPKSKIKKKKRKKFAWKIVGLTNCSKECGGGIQTAIFKCIREHNEMVVHERRCRTIEKQKDPPPLRCNDHPCAAKWRAEHWGECSVTCGAGIRTRKIECVQELNAKLTMRVAAGACMQPPDLRTVESCSKPACPNPGPELRNMQSQYNPPRWNVGNWTPCSTTCGPGIKRRTVTCITSGEPCPPSDKPESQKVCENVSCNIGTPDQWSPWLYSEWSSKCSVDCGTGFYTRQVACADGSELFCNPKHKPSAQKSCVGSGKDCDKAKWFTGPWTSCSVSCGMGVQHRNVLCLKKVENEYLERPADECNGSRPSHEQVCKTDDCPAEWFTSNWSQCSVTCGDGVQTRLVRCIFEGVGNTNCSKSLEPPWEQRCQVESCKKDTIAIVKPPKKVHETSECVDKYPNCNLVVKNGLCRIKYYKHSCCQCRE